MQERPRDRSQPENVPARLLQEVHRRHHKQPVSVLPALQDEVLEVRCERY